MSVPVASPARLSEEQLRAKVQHWSPGRWEETLPILRYCKENGVRLFAAGVPPEVSQAAVPTWDAGRMGSGQSWPACCVFAAGVPPIVSHSPHLEQVLRTVQLGGIWSLRLVTFPLILYQL